MSDEKQQMIDMITALARAITIVYGDWVTSRDCRHSMDRAKSLALDAFVFTGDVILRTEKGPR